MKFKVWLDSGANHQSCYKQEIEIDDLTPEEWVEMPEQEKDEIMKEYAWDRMDWGYEIIDEA